MGLLDAIDRVLGTRIGLLVNDPRAAINALESDARAFNQASLLATQAERNANRGLPVTPEQLEAKRYIDRKNEDLAMGFAGTVLPGQSWMGKKIPSVEKLAKQKDKFLYHSDTAKNIQDLQYGIEPQQGGKWIREIAEGTGVDPEEIFARQTPMAWFSDQPTWVKIKVAREVNKPIDKVTVDDIRKHGHLAIINKKDPYLKDIWKVGKEGLSEGEYSKVTDIKGKQVPAYQTQMYQEGLSPFGVERNEWVATQSVDPFVQLTGDDLVKYLQLTGLLGK